MMDAISRNPDMWRMRQSGMFHQVPKQVSPSFESIFFPCRC
jgi:hypothetical protein